MIDLRNYALLAEQKKFGYFNKLNESGPDQQSDAGLKAVLSGKTDAKYLNQWEQLVADFNKNVQTPGLHTVIINHDDGKTQMVSIDYQIGTDKKPIKGSVVLTPAVKTLAPTGTVTNPINYTDVQLQADVDTLVDELDGIVNIKNLQTIKTMLTKYIGHFGLGDDDTTKVSAIGRILTLYKRDESGDTLPGDIADVGTSTLAPEAEKLKSQLATLLKPYKEEA